MKTLKSKFTNRLVWISTFSLCLLILSFAPYQSGILIKGKVMDATTKQSMSGTNIILKGTTSGVLADTSGNFSIIVPDSSAILVFRFVGYTIQEKKVGKERNFTISMKQEYSKLEEVVVIGYGQVKKSCSTGSVNTSKPNVSNKRQKVIASSDYLMSSAENISSNDQIVTNSNTNVVSVNRNQTAQPLNNPVNKIRANNPVYYDPSRESYIKIDENRFKWSKTSPLSTFSINVDKASYTNVKRFLNNGLLPPADAVRVEELVNYFSYDYPQPVANRPVSITTEYTDCPWQSGLKILHIGLQGKTIPYNQLPSSNLVFLIDVSGSMAEINKLPLLKTAFKMLVDTLRPNDRVAIVVYAGAAGIVLNSTPGNEKTTIVNAIDGLQAGGSTAGAAGIEMAYRVAQENFIKGGNNRVILATDGDFNVGVSSDNELQTLIEKKRETGVFLTCLGVGTGNYKDAKMQLLAKEGNGNYFYLNDVQEAGKVLINEFSGTLFTIAKDVKVQIEFNPSKVQAYRLLGYENRALNDEDFKDDGKNAGELGSGHTVTAIYEIIPVGVNSKFLPNIDDLKYQLPGNEPMKDGSKEIATVKIRYKDPDEDVSKEITHIVADKTKKFSETSDNFRFSVSVAMFGLLLRNSEFKGECSYKGLVGIADQARGTDKDSYRAEFIRLAKAAEYINNSQALN